MPFSVRTAKAVRSTAHALKGLAAGCGGVRAAQAAQRVEHAGEASDLEDIDSLIETMECEFATSAPRRERVAHLTIAAKRLFRHALATVDHTSTGSPFTCTRVSIDTPSVRTLLRRQPRVMPSIRAAFD